MNVMQVHTTKFILKCLEFTWLKATRWWSNVWLQRRNQYLITSVPLMTIILNVTVGLQIPSCTICVIIKGLNNE